MKHHYRTLSRVTKVVCLLVVLLFGAAQTAKACHGASVITPSYTVTPTSIQLMGYSDPATCGCGPYYLQAEVAFTAACFTGNTPVCGDPSWNTYPFYYSLLDIPGYTAANGWPDNCVTEPYDTIVVPFSDLCPGTNYVIRVREYVCGSSSAGPWSSAFAFTTPGTPPSTNLTTTASQYDGCPGDLVQLNASAAGGCPGTLFTYSWSPTTGLSNPNIANPVLTIQNSTTIYTVTIISSCGAPVPTTSDDTVQITVGPPPIGGAVSAAPNSVCSGGSSVLTVSGQDPASTVQWQISTNGITWFNIAGATSTTYNTGPITSTLYYQAVVTGSGWWPGSGCGSTASGATVVTVNPSPTADAGVNQSVCSGSCVTLNGTGGVSYDWQPVNQNTQSINVCPTSSTTYTLTVTDANGCTGTDNVTVNISSASVTASPNVSICNGNSTILVASGPNGNSYNWTPNGSLTGSTTANPTATPTTTTTYTVTATNAIGCTAVDSVVVTVTAAPPLTVSNDTAMCAGGTAVLNVSGASSYTWQPTNQTTSSISVSPVSTTTYVVTGNTNNCVSTDSIVVTIAPPPAVYAGPDFDICSGTQATLNVSTTGSSYNWQPTTGIIGSNTVQNIVIQPTVNTSYTVTVVGSNGCISTDTIAIAVNPAPNVSASSTDNTICVGQTTSVSGSGGVTYSWIPTVGLLNPNQVTTSATPPNTTTYQVIGFDANGCSDTASVTITVNPLPDVYITTTPSECGDSSGVFSFGGVVAGTGPFTYQIGNQTYTNLPIPNYPEGSYNVVVTDANGCVSTEQVNIAMTNTASINASASPMFGVYPLNVSFNAGTSGGINNWLWTFGDPASSPSSQQNPSYTYTQPGTYIVHVLAWNDDPSCYVIDSIEIEVVEQAMIQLPNVFTPNGDGTNDNFSVTLTGVKDLNVQVYDRWGKQVRDLSLTDLPGNQQTLDLWDGKSGSGEVTDGVYYYVFRATGYDGKDYPYTGFVQLIRGN